MPLSKIVAKSITDDTITTDQIADTSVQGRRNLIINGAATVNQRGDVTGKTSSTYGGPDRFRLGLSTSGTWSISQSSTAPDGFSNSYKLDCTTADTTPTVLISQYRIEAQDVQHLQYGSSGAEKVTVSFYVRSNVTGTYVLELQTPDTTRHIAKTYTISSADTWELKTLTFDGDTGGAGITDDNGVGIQLNFWLGASSTYTSGTLATSWASQTTANRAAGLNVNLASSTDNEWLITGLQFEVGEVSNPVFERRSYGEELALCHRYFQKIYLNSYCCMLSAENSQQAKGGVIRFSEKRANPTITFPTIGTGSNQLAYTEKTGSYVTQGSTFRSTQTKTQMSIFNNYSDGFSGMDAGENIMLYVNGSCEIDVKAEL